MSMRRHISPEEALKIGLMAEETRAQHIKTYELSRCAAFFAKLTAALAKEVNERIQRGEIV